MSNYIVAIDLGSSKIAGIVAERTAEGLLRIVAVEEEASVSIKRGLVTNHSEAAFCVKRIIEKLQNRISEKIAKVYIGLGGNTIKTISNHVYEHFEKDQPLTEEHLYKLRAQNPTEFEDEKVYEIYDLETLVDGEATFNAVSNYCSDIEGRYLLVVGRKGLDDRLCGCLERVPTQLASMFTAPFAIGEALVDTEEKEVGCVVIDFGAETTTVIVYANYCIRHMRVIPIGGKSITKDISELKVTESAAEKLKLDFGYAMTSLEEKPMPLKFKRSNMTEYTVHTKEVNEIIEARIDEIMNMVCEEIYKSGYWGKLGGGVVITGGASQLRGLSALVELKTGMPVRYGNYAHLLTSDTDKQFIKPEYTLLAGLLNFGTENCCAIPVQETEELPKPEKLKKVKPPKEPRTGGFFKNVMGSLFNERDFE